jgi:hypothetical protein
MKHKLTLTITFLCSRSSSSHFTGRKASFAGGRREVSQASLWCSSWSSGCTERCCSGNGRSADIIMLLGSISGLGVLVIHIRERTCRRQDCQFQWSLFLGLDAHRARRGLLHHPLGARLVGACNRASPASSMAAGNTQSRLLV